VAIQSSRPAQKGAVLLDARAQEEAERQDRHRSEEITDVCAAIEEDLEALKARFEMYFLGIERREPAREREEMKRRVAKVKGEFVRNTALRFRIQTLHARYLSYERMWLRAAREKEEGTYRRDLLRARRHRELEERKAKREGAKAGATAAAGQGASTTTPVTAGAAATATSTASATSTSTSTATATATGAATASATGPAIVSVTAAASTPGTPAATSTGARSAGASASPPAARAATPSAPAAPPPAGMTPAQLRALYDAYVDAKRRCQEDVSKLSYDALARTVAKQVPELMVKYGAKAVEFKVVVKDGRAILKAVPKV
jgi:hypothetical protein